MTATTNEADHEPNPVGVRGNALVHGIYSDQVVLPWEQRDEFDELHRRYREELNPEGPLEDDIVGQIVQLQWIKGRLFRNYRIQLATNPLLQELVDAANQGYQGIERLVSERRVTAARKEINLKNIRIGPREFDAVVAALKEAQTNPSLLSGSIQIEQPESTEAAAKHLTEDIEMLRTTESILEQVCRPGEINRFVRELGSLDARIEKAIARLIGVKEYKKMYGRKTISAQ